MNSSSTAERTFDDGLCVVVTIVTPLPWEVQASVHSWLPPPESMHLNVDPLVSWHLEVIYSWGLVRIGREDVLELSPSVHSLILLWVQLCGLLDGFWRLLLLQGSAEQFSQGIQLPCQPIDSLLQGKV